MDDGATTAPIVGVHIANIITWLCLVIATLSLAARYAVKWVVARKIGGDDILVAIAFVFALLSGFAATLEACNGLGMPLGQLSPQSLQTQLMSAYLGRISFLAAISFAKVSIVAFIRQLSPVELHRRITTGFAVFVALLWAVETIAVALSCSPPQPWDISYGKCINLNYFWEFVGAMNIFTDLALVFLPFLVTKNLQMCGKKKMIVLACFASRVVDVGATAVLILYATQFQILGSEPHMWEFLMSTQIVQCVTLVTSCIPYLRGILESMPSGMYNSDELRRRALHSAEASRVESSSYVLKNIDDPNAGVKPKLHGRNGKVPHGSTLSSWFTQTNVAEDDGESIEYINAEIKLSRSATLSDGTDHHREASEGGVSLATPEICKSENLA